MVVLGGGKIPVVKKGNPKHSAEFQVLLKGRTFTLFDRRAKYLIVRLDNGAALLIHLRMSGQLIVIPKSRLATPLLLSKAKAARKELLPTKHTHAIVTCTDGTKLFYNDVRQFGHIRYVPASDLQSVIDAQQLGPEPLEMKHAEFAEIVAAHKKRAIKAVLLDQQAIAGIGNIYADESLFAAKVNPSRPAGRLDANETKVLYTELQRILHHAIRHGGSSLEYFLKTNGSGGSFAHEHQVYGKAGEHCPRCGEVLESKVVAGRTSTYCPVCQKR
jgi:formamidopyrimidine-DNA glycosylase